MELDEPISAQHLSELKAGHPGIKRADRVKHIPASSPPAVFFSTGRGRQHAALLPKIRKDT